MIMTLDRLKLPDDFHVDCCFASGASAHWSDADRRYHFWLNDDSMPQNDVLHSNPLVPSKQYGVNEHRALSMSAKKWAPLVAAMLDKITNRSSYEVLQPQVGV
jgi:hypothetical protein